MNWCRLILVTLPTAVLVSVGSARDTHAALTACVAGDITARDPKKCPASGPCTVAKVFTIADGCVLDFGTRDVTIAGSGELSINTGEVSLYAGNFTVAANGKLSIGAASVSIHTGNFTVAAGGSVDGRTTTLGGFVMVKATGNIAVQRSGASVGKILVSGKVQGGAIHLDADGDMTIAGQLHANNRDAVGGAGGEIALYAGGDIVTTSTGEIDLNGGLQAGGGSLEVEAGGRIDIGKAIDATGEEGGSININAGGKVTVRDKLNTSGTGDGGGGGEVYITAGTNVEINGQIQNRGGGSPTDSGGGDGGKVSVSASVGEIDVRSEINVQAGYPDAGGGDIKLYALGSIYVESTARLIAEGSGIESWGGEILLDAGVDATVSGSLQASGGESGGTIRIDAGRSVSLSKVADVRGTTAGGFGGGSVTIEAGKLTRGNVSITGEGKIDARGGGCDADLGCSAGGNADLAGCEITVRGRGISASAPGNTGEGGNITLSARGRLIIRSVVDATGAGKAGRIIFVHPSLTLPDIVPPSLVTPRARTVACCRKPAGPTCSDSSCTGLCERHCHSLCNCGNGAVDEFEQCDGDEACGSGHICTAPGEHEECVCIGTCGNEIVDPSEQCDGSKLGGETCVSQGYLGGSLTCVNCKFDFSGCTVPKCGDGFITKPGEACDPNITIDQTCSDVGFFAGDPLLCVEDCTGFDTTACDDGVCGDAFHCVVPGCESGPAGGPEECDDGNTSDNDSCLNDCSRARCGDNKLCTEADCDTGPNGGAEQCDDGNDDDNDPCRVDCRRASCGDGTVCSAASCKSGPGGGPEECEPHRDPKCCLSDCTLRTCKETGSCSPMSGCCPPGESCDDGNPCTDDQCKTFSGCQHTFNSLPCDDGDVCTVGDTCSKGRCAGTAIDGCCLTDQQCEVTDRCFVGACDATVGACRFVRRVSFDFLDCIIRYEVAELAASIQRFADELGPKETKRLGKLLKKVSQRIEAASAENRGRKAFKQLKKADKQLKKLQERLEKLAKKKGKGEIAGALTAQATAVQQSVELVKAELSQ